MSTEGLHPGSPIAVVGAGLMGSQIAAEYALAGHPVALQDVSEAAASRGCARAVAALDRLATLGLTTPGKAAQASERLRPVSDLALACRGRSLVIESVFEDVEVKAGVIRGIADAAPDALIASNTSSCPIGLLGQRTSTADRLIGTHYWNPPLLMSLVEVIPGKATAPDVTSLIVATLERMGKDPVVVPDIPGFVWNRLQFALLREAVSLVRRHGVPPATIDMIVRRGLGRRWSMVGPFEGMALGGPATFKAVAALLFPQLASDADSTGIDQIELPPANELGDILERRDALLAELLLRDRAGEITEGGATAVPKDPAAGARS